MTARKNAVPVTQLVGAPPRKLERRDGLINHIAIVVDNSASMGDVRTAARQAVNEQIATVKEQARITGQKTTVNVYLFDRDSHLHQSLRAEDVEPLTLNDYPANGPSTSLNDAVRRAITDLQNEKDAAKPNVSFLVVTVTDGIENSSRNGPINHLVRDVQSTDRWSLAFLAPPGGTSQLVALGIPSGNIREWERTEAGTREMGRVSSQGISSYYGLRTLGHTSTKSLYTDLSNVPQAKVAALVDLTTDFKRLKVEKETEIAPFCHSKGYNYELGRAYYELTKAEKIASHKDIAILDRGTNRIHGGTEARKLLGITTGAGVLCKVIPGNHANYRVFVSSTSTNRKLVRGTELLYKVR